MQSDYPEHFERDVGCSEAEWLGWMPRALGTHAWRREGARITVDVPPGALDITCALEPDWPAWQRSSPAVTRRSRARATS